MTDRPFLLPPSLVPELCSGLCLASVLPDKSGRLGGTCARRGSHTTGRAVFRIRRLETKRGLTREVDRCNEPISLENVIAEGFLQHGVPGHAPSPATTVRRISPRWWDSQDSEASVASARIMPA